MQILFVDRSDTVRARVATGLFERVAEWNGYGRALYPSAAGVDAEGGAPDFGTTASLLAMAGMLGIRSKLFAADRERFVYDDFDRLAGADSLSACHTIKFEQSHGSSPFSSLVVHAGIASMYTACDAAVAHAQSSQHKYGLVAS